MTTRITFFFSFISFWLPSLCWSQLGENAAQKNQNRNWTWGVGWGLHFGTSGISPFVSKANIRGTAMSDRRTGELLFYTEGFTIFDRNHDSMPNAHGFRQSWISKSGLLITPVAADSNRYYVFMTDNKEWINEPDYGISYSIVDMRLNGGMGDVTVKNIPLVADAAARICAIRHANGHDYWIVTHSRDENYFRTFLVTVNGIDPVPVESRAGLSDSTTSWRYPSPGREITSSPDNRLIAMARYYYNHPQKYKESVVELFAFNNATGKVEYSNVVHDQPYEWSSGVCFSPNSKMLYSSASHLNDFVYTRQIAIDSFTSEGIKVRNTTINYRSGNSLVAIGDCDFHLGIDGKIYFGSDVEVALGAILYPDHEGLACERTDSLIVWSTGSGGANTEPQNIITDGILDSVRGIFNFREEPKQCFQPCYELSLSGALPAHTAGNYSYSWDLSSAGLPVASGERTSVCFPVPGDYTISLIRKDEAGQRDTMTRMVRAPVLAGSAQVTELPERLQVGVGNTVSIPLSVTLADTLRMSSFDVARLELRVDFDTSLLSLAGALPAPMPPGYQLLQVIPTNTGASVTIADTLDASIGPSISVGSLKLMAKKPAASTSVRVTSLMAHSFDSSYVYCTGEQSTLATLQLISAGVNDQPKVTGDCHGKLTVMDLLGRVVCMLESSQSLESAMEKLPAAIYFVGCRELGFTRFMKP